MKKISSKALLITGLIVEFGGPLFIVFIALLFPNLSAEVGMSLSTILQCLGVIIFVFSLAKNRFEKGKIKASNPIRALTPAQIVLVLSMLLIVFVMVCIAFGNNALDGLGAIAFFGIIASIVLAIIRAIKRFIERKAVIFPRRVTHTPQSSSSQYRPKEYCERCGAEGDEGTLIKLNGNILCGKCAEIMRASKGAEILNPKAECCDCHKEFEKTKMVFVDDKYLCENCFRTRYADPTHSDQ